MSLAERVRSQALAALEKSGLSHDELNNVLRLFAKYRSVLIQNTILNQYGSRVQGGPFAGMEFLSTSAEGCHAPKLLGCYERELHPVIEAVADTGYEAIVNIGCAEGYYAVGLARCCPNAQVIGYDDNPGARQACRELALRNGVAERVTVAGLFEPQDFRTFAGRRTLFMFDIEGHELSLLEHVPAGELAAFDFIIECHDCFGQKICERLTRHLEPSHALRVVRQELTAVELPPLFAQVGHLDQLLAIWEWRSGPTPWLLAASRQWPDAAFLRAVYQE